MSRNWHDTFAAWSKPPSDTEETKAANAARMINDALRANTALAKKNFEVTATGSYRNNTNTSTESDIDIAVVLKDACWSSYPADGSVTAEMLNFQTAKYGLTNFRDDVGRALTEKFGTEGISQGDKAFNIHENSYRLEADVAVFLEHRRYTGKKDAAGAWLYDKGAETRPRSDANRRIINWHQFHYEHGVAKNDVTKRRFKRTVRIMKRLRDDMGMKIPSFLLECLCFNASDTSYNKQEHTIFDDVRAVVAEMWNLTKPESQSQAAKLVEVSKMKMLFGDGNKWTPAETNKFLLQVWQHVGFK